MSALELTRQDWLTAEQAMLTLQCSIATLKRYVQRRKIRTDSRRVPGRRPLTIYHPADVAELASQTLQPVPSTALTTTQPIDITAVEPKPSFHLPLDKQLAYRFLTLKECMELTGLSREALKRAIDAQHLTAVRDGSSYKISLPALAAFASR